MPTLNTYFKILRKQRSPIDCPHCHELVAAEMFEDHCRDVHSLNPKTNCPWCFGNAFWSDGSKKDRADHLVACCISFFASRERGPPSPVQAPSDTPVPFDSELMHVEKNFGDRCPLPDLPETPVWAVEPPLKGLTFQCPRVNLAAACIQLYLNSKHSSDWMHVMVRAPAFLGFLKAVDADAGKTRTLPFSCMCTGGGVAHRHFVVFTTPRNHFSKTTWKRIQCRQKNSHVKREPIRTPMQLVYLLGSLAQNRSECDFDFYELGPEPEGESNRYYVNLSLPRAYKIVLAMQWDGGILELIRRAYASVDPQLLIPFALNFNGLFGIPFRHLPGISKNCVLPVSEKFLPTSTPTEFYVHLFNGAKLYFESRAEPPRDWATAQAEKKNVFYDSVGDAIYYPTPYQQKCIRSLKRLFDEMVALQCQSARTNCDVQELQASNSSLKRSNRILKRKYKASENELKNLQCRHIRYLERENDKLRTERDCLKKVRISSSGCEAP